MAYDFVRPNYFLKSASGRMGLYRIWPDTSIKGGQVLSLITGCNLVLNTANCSDCFGITGLPVPSDSLFRKLILYA